MKNAISQIFILLVAVCLSMSCSKKDQQEDQIIIDDANLTPCPENGTCTYFYVDNNDIVQDQFVLKSGAFRVFTGNMQSGITSNLFFIKAPMNTSSFTLTQQDILNGALKYTNSCPTCFSAGREIIGGYVKGVSLNRPSRPDEHRWLVEAQIVLKYTAVSPAVTDTIKLKQYFNPGFLNY